MLWHSAACFRSTTDLHLNYSSTSTLAESPLSQRTIYSFPHFCTKKALSTNAHWYILKMNYFLIAIIYCFRRVKVQRSASCVHWYANSPIMLLSWKLSFMGELNRCLQQGIISMQCRVAVSFFFFFFVGCCLQSSIIGTVHPATLF